MTSHGNGAPPGDALNWSFVSRDQPRACRAHAAERFSIARSAEGYLELYERVLAGETLD